MDITWLPIDGFTDYEMSDHGHVRSLDKCVWNGRGWYVRPGRVLVPFITPKGYHAVGLWRDGKYHRELIHRLVYAAFVGDCAGRQVRHWPDADKSKNTPDNLAVGTNSDNQLDSVAHGTHHHARKEECLNGHPFDEANTRWYRTAKGGMARACRRCRADRERERRRQKALLTASA